MVDPVRIGGVPAENLTDYLLIQVYSVTAAPIYLVHGQILVIFKLRGHF
jgi:hypothetical protein